MPITRLMGCIKAKVDSNGDYSDFISSKPEILSFKIYKEYNYILLGTKGFFSKVTPKII